MRMSLKNLECEKKLTPLGSLREVLLLEQLLDNEEKISFRNRPENHKSLNFRPFGLTEPSSVKRKSFSLKTILTKSVM